MSADLNPGDNRHSYAVIASSQHALEVSSTFITAGLGAAERVTLVGLTDRQLAALFTRMRQDGTDPTSALRDGQLVALDRSRSQAFYSMGAQQVGNALIKQATAAVRDGYAGIRFGGLAVGTQLSRHEAILNRVVHGHPARALCLYHARASVKVLSDAGRQHDRLVPSRGLLDDGELRVSVVSPQAVRLAGRIHPGNRQRVLAVLAGAARQGHHIFDAASLREVDPDSMQAILTAGLGITLTRPNLAVQRRAGAAPARVRAVPAADVAGRTGAPVAGQTASQAVTNLIWRTFGQSRRGRAESVLDWAGLLGRPAAPVSEVADRHGIAPGTLSNRVRQVRSRGAATPLTALILRDAARHTQPSEDDLGRQRVAHLLGLPPPMPC